MIQRITVTDIRTGRVYESIRDAWEVYAPEVAYNTFTTRLFAGTYKHLVRNTPIETDKKPDTWVRKRCMCMETGKVYETIMAATRDIDGIYQGVQRSCRTNGGIGHKGYHFRFVEDDFV